MPDDLFGKIICKSCDHTHINDRPLLYCRERPVLFCAHLEGHDAFGPMGMVYEIRFLFPLHFYGLPRDHGKLGRVKGDSLGRCLGPESAAQVFNNDPYICRVEPERFSQNPF